MKKVIAILFILVITGLVVYTVWQEDLPKPTVDQINTADWETYTSDEFDFSLKHPPSWKVYEGVDDPVTPKINVYAPGSDTEKLPYTHHTSDVAHVSIFPEGIPTEGVFGVTRESKVAFTAPVTDGRDYLLKNGEAWATIANFLKRPDSWREAGFIFAKTMIKNQAVECYRGGEEIVQKQCDPMTGDNIAHTGSIDTEIRAVEKKILQSLQFTGVVNE